MSSGIDLIEIERIEKALDRHGEHFLKKIFSVTELERLVKFRERQVNPRLIAAEVAARFAAKEACSKALGTGIGPVSWREMEILNERSGKPILRLTGKAAQIAGFLGYTSWSVSLTHTRGMAAALVVAAGD
ncbi:MAG: holo-[acyl-carrier-protein] synthase [Chloroflexota bacterium]|nr:MAG: holo-[acyl-carrier-protein] synthase [Chloroflexota bacterium]